MYLTKFEQDFLRQFLKNAQQAPVETPQTDPQAISNLAKKLINRLNSPTGTSDAPYFKDLNSFPNLLNYLAYNKEPHQGKQIVYRFDPSTTFQGANGIGADFAALSPDEKKDYLPFPSQNPSFYVSKSGLIAYLQAKQVQAVQEPDQLLGALVGQRINDANQMLNLKIPKESSKSNQDSNTKQLDDNDFLDRIANPVPLDKPIMADGQTVIHVKDLKSPANFNEFIKTLTILKDNQKITYVQFADSTFCEILNFLHARAESKHYRTKDAYARSYLDMVEKLMGEYSCQITKTRPNTDKANSTQDYKPVAWRSGQSLPPNVVKEVSEMRYPLLPDRIDFTWIKQWLQSYEQIENQLGNQLSPAFSDALKFVSNLVNFGFDSQDLNDTAEGIYRAIYSKAVQSVPPQQAIHLPLVYLRTMMNMLVNLKAVLNSFKRDFWYGMHPEWQSEFNTQVNGTTNSYAERSILQVQQWINSLPSAQTKVDKELG